MTNKPKEYIWQKQSLVPQVRAMDCPVYDEIKDFRRDKTGIYVLIRADVANKFIELAVCNKDHQIVAIFRGKKCQDVYEAIFKYEQEHNLVWFSDKGHIAYLGKELKKAELSLESTANPYLQE